MSDAAVKKLCALEGQNQQTTCSLGRWPLFVRLHCTKNWHSWGTAEPKAADVVLSCGRELCCTAGDVCSECAAVEENASRGNSGLSHSL